MSIHYVMAATAEYGTHLRRRIDPLITGVGPVEAAIAVTRHLATHQLPSLVVSLGSAGSRTLMHGQVYQATAVSYRDMDASALGVAKGVTPFLDLPAILPLPITVPGLATATLSTGANVVSGAAYDQIEADMVDMETFAVQRVCMQFGVPLIALRGISDGRADLTGMSDWTDYLHIVDENLAAAVDRIEAAMAAGTLLP